MRLPALLVSAALALGAAPAEPTATVKACTGVENHQCVGEGTAFKKDDMVVVWSEVRGANDKEALHVWKKGGKDHHTAHLHIGSVRWSTQSRMPRAQPGDYTVEVMVDDKKIGEVSFKVE